MDSKPAAPGMGTPFPHFFVLGFQRSGTTMLRLMLNAHPMIAVPHETFFIPLVAARLENFGPLTDPAARARLLDAIGDDHWVQKGEFITPEGRAAALAETSYPAMVQRLFEAHAVRAGKPVWGDKTPNYTHSADILARLFPDARFIHLVRDVRAVASAMKRVEWGTDDVETLAIKWTLATLSADRVGHVLADRYLRVRYEELISDPADALARMCAHLGLPFDAAMLEFHRTSNKHTPDKSKVWHQNSMRAPNVAKIAEWRSALSPAEISLIEGRAAPALDRFGYDMVNAPATPGLRLSKALVQLKARLPYRPAKQPAAV